MPKTKKDILEEIWKDFSVVDPNHIVAQDAKRGLIYIGGELADHPRLHNLRAEAEAILQMDIWKILCETPKELAHKEMFINGDDAASIQKGRSILFMLHTQKKILEILKSYAQK